jgi:purine-nucleoside phosphorylase
VYNRHPANQSGKQSPPNPLAVSGVPKLMQFLTRTDYEMAANYVRSQTQHKPQIGIVLGSGLGELADAVDQADRIPFDKIPNWPPSTVSGHAGTLHIGRLEGRDVMIMQGRIHFYEGYGMDLVTLPIRVMQLMGLDTVVLTNAAGGINPTYRAGDVMLLRDHINLIGMAGQNPLRGPNDDTLGTRFPDMTRVYDRELRNLALKIAQESGIALHQGVYMCLAGPSFETPADIRFLRAAGVDAVGMSTVPEAIVARHAGMRVLGFSGISNAAIDDPDTEAVTTHEEVLEAGKVIVPKLQTLIRGVLREIST